MFVSLDLFLFYLFWDAMLIPMYFLIGIWGYDRRIYAAIKFILYTMAGSVLMLVAILWLASFHQAQTGVPSFDLADLLALSIPAVCRRWLFLAFAVAFAIKVPIFPFHTWLPDAHVEAPTAGSVILAGVLLKMGTYGLLRFAFPLFPEAARYLRPVPGDARRDRHRLRRARRDGAAGHEEAGGLLVGEPPGLRRARHLRADGQGVQGSVSRWCARHLTGGLFLIVGMLSDRRHTRQIAEFGGLKAVMPRLVAAFLLITLASVALPGMNGFVGEFLILLGTFASPFSTHARLFTAIAATGVILSAVYMLWMFQRVNYGTVTNAKNRALRDLSVREWFVIGPVCAVAILMGVAPNLFLKPMEPAVRRVVEHVRGTNLPMNAERKVPARDPLHGAPPAPTKVAVVASDAMTQTDFAAIAPMLIVVLAACAVLLAEAFRGKDERMPFELLGLIGLAGSIAASVLQWHQEKVGFGVIIIDHYSLVLQHHDRRHRRPDDPPVGRRRGTRSVARRRVRRAHAVLDRRHDADGRDARPAGHLHRPRDALARRLRHDRPPPGQRGGRRGGVQVFRARRVLERVLPLRHRACLCGLREPRSSTNSACRSRARRSVRTRILILAMVFLLVGLCVQSLGGAVPHVDAGCLPGRAHARDRVHVHRREGGGVCGVRTRLPVGTRTAAG